MNLKKKLTALAVLTAMTASMTAVPASAYDCFNGTCVKEILLAIIICWGCYDHKIGIFICRFGIKGSGQIKLFFGKIFFYVIVLNGRFFVVYQVNFFWNNIYCRNFIMLCKQNGEG